MTVAAATTPTIQLMDLQWTRDPEARESEKKPAPAASLLRTPRRNCG